MQPNTLSESGSLIGKMTYQLIAETLGVKDPYKLLKEQYNQLAMDHYEELEHIINASKDPIFFAIAASALGNTMDLGGSHDIDLVSDIKNFSPNKLTINDVSEFKKSLKNAKQILIIGDNAGEIVFDKLLIVTLKKFYPKMKVIYTVRDGPIINDATMEDAKSVGLTDVAAVIEAPATPGIVMALASDEFKQIFYSNGGILLTKGQGNFESLYKVEVPNKEVYYLLKAKCTLMEKIFSVKLGDLIFKKKTSGF